MEELDEGGEVNDEDDYSNGLEAKMRVAQATRRICVESRKVDGIWTCKLFTSKGFFHLALDRSPPLGQVGRENSLGPNLRGS